MHDAMNQTLQARISAYIRTPEAVTLQVSAMRLQKIQDREPSRVSMMPTVGEPWPPGRQT